MRLHLTKRGAEAVCASAPLFVYGAKGSVVVSKYEIVYASTTVIRRTSKSSQRMRARQRWYAAGSMFGIVGGILFPLLVNWVTFATIPLVGFGLWCLTLLVENSVPTKSSGQPVRPHPNLPDSVNRALTRDASAHRTSALGSHLGITAGAALILCCAATVTHAQQTIFNVPSTDVLDRGKIYAQLDVPFKPNDSDSVSRFSSFVPRIVAGAGRRTEVGLNVAGNIQPGPDQTTLVPMIKHKLYDGGDISFALIAANKLFVPDRNRASRLGNYTLTPITRLARHD